MRKERKTDRAEVRARRLIVCLLLAAAAAALRFAAPNTAAQVRERAAEAICGSVDIRCAAEAIGEGIGGERPLEDALRSAYRYAFFPTGSEAVPADGIGG